MAGGEVITIRIGGVTYRKFGVLFTPNYEEEELSERIFHASCVNIPTYQLFQDRCGICYHEKKEEYYFDPMDSAIEITEGYIADKGRVEDRRVTYAHFTCACDEWDLPLWQL